MAGDDQVLISNVKLFKLVSLPSLLRWVNMDVEEAVVIIIKFGVHSSQELWYQRLLSNYGDCKTFSIMQIYHILPSQYFISYHLSMQMLT